MPITLGVRHYVVVALAILVLLVVMGIGIYPALYVQYIQEMGIKRFEAEYGFKTGSIAMSSPTRPASAWGIVSVAPDGKFAKVGVRSGDVPFAYHGGVTAMYAALLQADAGEASSFEVYNGAEVHSALRTIRLPAPRER